MEKISKYVKRLFKFIISGQPNVNITMEIVQKTSQEMFRGKRILITRWW